MQKSLMVVCFLAVLVGSFLGSIWYHQAGTEKKDNSAGGHKILYYVDPMNPAHTSDKPGLAPCGMPMEPVYAENESDGGWTSLRHMPPGTAKISPEKQQIIGVRVERVEMASQMHTLRTLGRVAADENLTYRVIASTDGWVREVQGSTTGSMVQKDQLMATISSYSADFYSWQQQYLTYTGYPRLPVAQTSRTKQPDMDQGTEFPSARFRRPRQPEAMEPAPPQAEAQIEMQQHGSQQPGGMQTEAQPSAAQYPKARFPKPQLTETMPTGTTQPESHQHGSQQPAPPQAEAQAEMQQHGSQQPEAMQTELRPPAAQSPRDLVPKPQVPGAMPTDMRPGQATQRQPQDFSPKQPLTRLNLADYNAYRAKLELLNLGFTEEQLDELVQTGQYGTEVDIRAPVTGFVLTRNVSSRQKADKGAELFRIADLSHVWILADIFEREASFVRPGTSAHVSIPQQGGSFEAKVTDVLPQFDTTTRTLKVRLEVDNPEFALVPDMFVDVEFHISLPPAITVPVDAVLDSGLRKTVFVDVGNGFFEPRSVNTGWRYGGRVEIVNGIMPGESVVVSGNFLVDSESRMKLAAAGMHGTLTKDPACGMDVYAEKAKNEGLVSTFEGKTFYFCSRECKALFDGQHGRKVTAPVQEMQPDKSGKPAIPSETSMNGFWKDPVCGMLLPADKARTLGFKSEYGGRTYYFCSEHCRKQFEGSQERYLEKAAAGQGQVPASGHGGHQHD